MKITGKSRCLQTAYSFWEVTNIRPEKLVSRRGDRSNIFQFWQIGIALVATSGVIFSGNNAIAQIVPDRTLGKESSVVTPNVDIKGVPSDRIDGGAIRGSGLFHSFQEFNVREGRGAYFNNPAGIENIFSRVTGTNASNIFGKLGVLGNANLFLLNPNGIIFGPNASLDIAGSFSASTANSLNFGDAKFSATNPTGAPLLSVKVPLGVQFNQNQPSAIANSGNLSVGGQNLNLMGGTVVSTGQLSAPGGQVAVASVPGGSVVNLSPSAQFLNIETPSPVASVGSSSLTKLLTSVDERQRPGLTVNSNGQVELTRSGLPVVDGDLVAQNVIAQTATLTANNNLTLVESQLGTTGDLNLLARDTVRVRDSVANPFVAQAGGKLLVQGRQGVDIFALNNSSSGLVSGGDMVLRSLNTVGGDAHYWAGGNFRIEKLDGSLGGLFSPYDPIIYANRDVSFGKYTGGSLHILAGGSVTIDSVTITNDNTATVSNTINPTNTPQLANLTLFDGRPLVIDGSNVPTLDIRAGIDWTQLGGQPGNVGIGITVPPSVFGSEATSADITIRSIDNDYLNSVVLLTNRFYPNRALPTASITTGPISAFGLVAIDARNNIKALGNIDVSINRGTGGNIKLLSEAGGIDTRGFTLRTKSDNGVAGDVTLQARDDIRSGSIQASSNSSSGDPQTFSTIKLESSQGSVFVDRARLSTTNTGTDYAGDIYINGKYIQITNTGRGQDEGIQSQGVAGRIFIGTNDQGNVTADNVTISNSQLDAIRNVNSSFLPDNENNGIQIASNGRIQIETSSVFASTESTAPPGSISLKAGGSIDIKNNSNIISRVLVGAESPQQQIGFTPSITIQGSSINITNLPDFDQTQISATTNSRSGKAGDVTVKADSVLVSGNVESKNPTGIFAQAQNGGRIAGNITINTNNLTVENEAEVSVRSLTSNGQAGNLKIFADNISINNGAEVSVSAPDGQAGNLTASAKSISLNNGILRATTGLETSETPGANIFLQGLEDNSPLDFLLLRNESLIEANANNSATGGNVNINTELLIALPPTGERGSDITANAELGKGGQVNIRSSDRLGIYGIEFRRDLKPSDTLSNRLNDITASSQLGQPGTVTTAQPDVDPRRGFLQLPEDLGDSSRLITQSCPVGRTQAASSFTVTGRGGLPPSPSSALSSDALMGTTINASPRETRLMQSSSLSSTFVEAKGMNIGPKGEIIFTANPSKPTSDNSWQRNAGCNAQ
ncbi:two-partner secretion domain-containing protein [Nostoc sp.]|uniref:two-partner secretion domain-containing protein n=1 Tax=Nostoc sp. TaxID=1180 RepID=UPI002FF5D9A8